MKRTILLTLMLVALVGLWPADRAYSYSTLFYLGSGNIPDSSSVNVLNINNKNFYIYNRSSATDAYNSAYYGYTNSNFTGYYIGTIAGNTDNGNSEPFDTIIGHYLHDSNFSVNQLKVEYKGGKTYGSNSIADTTLTVTWDTTQSGTWSLTNAYGFGFYAVKGGTEFALYFVDPAQSNGDWTTR
ncbi:MAG: hypothetical protein Q8R89_08190, partial [Desulfomicrobium sp.]|nr:hypothetical protein [Desulfomicrobium sp.]